MTLTPGKRIGPYEITGAIGAGGMGEVFRARDTKLNREVAIKVLPAAFADDPERLARFTREAQTLASLNHPNIAAIYGIEEVPATEGSTGPGSRALVMELVEGEDLSAHLARGPIPIAEALPIARQITEALEAAHEQGIVHRDLKPANIKVREDGAVKVLDFGLAKATDNGSGATNSALSHSPTMSRHMTEAGMIIGTAAYMSPEQAKGKTVDKRTDIWAFGVVLYEMLTGRRAFRGDDVSETLASVLKDTLPMDALPAPTPPRIRRLIERCLDRDLKTRLRDIGEARIEISRIEAGGADAATSAPVGSVASRGWRDAFPWILAGAFAAAFLAALVAWAPWANPKEPTISLRLNVDLGAQITSTPSFSDDGHILAFAARSGADEPSTLRIQRLDEPDAAILRGTEGATDPFFSPDGKWVAFFAGGKLKKVQVTGGPVFDLCDVPDARGGTWSENGTIIFSPTSAGVLMSIPSAGGTPAALTAQSEAGGIKSHRRPQALPGGRAVLFTLGAGGDFENASIAVQPSPKDPIKVLIQGGYQGRYLRSGHIVYIHEGTMLAAPFDLERLEITGPAAPVLDHVMSNRSNGSASFSFSDRGSLVYRTETSLGSESTIAWMTRDGDSRPLLGPGDYSTLNFSPDGGRLAVDRREGGGNSDIWIDDWKRDAMSRLTFNPSQDSFPVWSPEGTAVVFSSQREGQPLNLYWQRADGTGEAAPLIKSPYINTPMSWHPSGRFLAYLAVRAGSSLDLMILPLEGDEASGWKAGEPFAFVSTPFRESGGAFSPDGRWLAYSSNESGRYEVYVRPFPGPGGKWQVSTEGGWKPMWSKSRNEILYSTPGGAIMMAPYRVDGDSFHPDRPRSWSKRLIRDTDDVVRVLALHPDGERIAVIVPDPRSDSGAFSKVVFIQDFFDDLRRLAPAAGK